MKFLSIVSVFFLAFLLFQCSDPPVSSVDTEVDGFKGENKGGGHSTSTVNNLSFPALLADGFQIVPILEKFTISYIGPYDGLTTAEVADLDSTGPWYAQKVEGNVWQGEYATYDSIPVAFIDWGDAMESVDPTELRLVTIIMGCRLYRR